MLRWLARRPSALSYRAVAQRWDISSAASNSKHTSIYSYRTASEPATSASNLSSQHGTERQTLEARSLLRALLRACGHLPDSFAQTWVKQHIYSGFRTHQTGAHCRHTHSVSEQRILKKLRDGRRALSKLQRANDGDTLYLQKVLMAAYGRTGKRRRELLKPLLQRPQNKKISNPSQSYGNTTCPGQEKAPADPELGLHEAGQESTTVTLGPPMTKSQPRPLSPQLNSLLLSQMQHGPPTLTRSNPRRLQPMVPDLNTWLRPMPQNRVKNIQKEHYAKLLSQALPPLPQAEWERLRDLACGTTEPELAGRQRRMDVSFDATDRSGMDALDVVVRYGKVPSRLKRRETKNPITRRSMRRIYAKVFSQCPLMQYNDEKQEWRVTWGNQAVLGRSEVAA